MTEKKVLDRPNYKRVLKDMPHDRRCYLASVVVGSGLELGEAGPNGQQIRALYKTRPVGFLGKDFAALTNVGEKDLGEYHDKLSRIFGGSFEMVLEGMPHGYECDLITQLVKEGYELNDLVCVRAKGVDAPAAFIGENGVYLTNRGEPALAKAHDALGKIFASYTNFERVLEELPLGRRPELVSKVKEKGFLFEVDGMGNVIIEGLRAGCIGDTDAFIVEKGNEKLTGAHDKLKRIYEEFMPEDEDKSE